MNGALASRAEVVKLARLLGTEPERLPGLERLPAEALHELRDQASDALFAAGRAGLERAAALAGRLPPPLVAQLAQHSLGPQLAARAAALIAPDRAVELARRLPVRFLADVALAIDPRRLVDTIVRLPPERIAEVGAELRERDEWVAIGAVVGYLSDDALVHGLDVLDDEALLRTGFVLEDKGRLPHLLEHLDDRRLAGVLHVAAAQGRWAEVVDLALNAGSQRARLAGVLAEASDAELDSLLDALAADAALREASAALVEAMPRQTRERLRGRVAARPATPELAEVANALDEADPRVR